MLPLSPLAVPDPRCALEDLPSPSSPAENSAKRVKGEGAVKLGSGQRGQGVVVGAVVVWERLLDGRRQRASAWHGLCMRWLEL